MRRPDLKKRMRVDVFYPVTVSDARIRAYAQEALEHWGGSFHPDDELFSGRVDAPQERMLIHKRARRLTQP